MYSEIINQFLKDIHSDDGKTVLSIFSDYLEDNDEIRLLNLIKRRKVKKETYYHHWHLHSNENHGVGYGSFLGYHNSVKGLGQGLGLEYLCYQGYLVENSEDLTYGSGRGGNSYILNNYGVGLGRSYYGHTPSKGNGYGYIYKD